MVDLCLAFITEFVSVPDVSVGILFLDSGSFLFTQNFD